MGSSDNLGGLQSKYSAKRREIERRLLQFRKTGKSGGCALFEELAFCILTPQSKALSCDEAIRELKETGLLFEGSAGEIAAVLSKKTRFHNKKATYLVQAREKFEQNGFAALKKATFSGTGQEARAALVKSVKGIGWKEASHYLRNVGRGNTIAILDRHVLKNLEKYGAISRLPKSLTPRRYLSIEKKMVEFCHMAGIPLAHLDLLFWSEETGRIFK
jgi:N-glycosylase/DNA lyase